MRTLAVCLNTRMGVQDNWMANLRALVDAEAPGDKKRDGYRAIATASGLDVEYVYQLYKGLKTLGPKKAKSIARAFANGRDLSWFDQPPGATTQQEGTDSSGTSRSVAIAVHTIAQFMTQADDVTRESVALLLSKLAVKPEDAPRVARMLEALIEAGTEPEPWDGVERRRKNVEVPIERRKPNGDRLQ